MSHTSASLAGYRPPLPSESFAERAEAAFREKILAPDFPCVAAKASVNTDMYRLHTYGEMATLGSTLALARDLRAFQAEQKTLDSDFTSFVSVFEAPAEMDELTFEQLVWEQLHALSLLDDQPYSEEVSSDSTAPDFGYSFGGQAFFIVGLHPGASRTARRFAYPMLVFNSHHQFRRLKADGRWTRFQQTIRARDMKLQGSINPNLADFGTASEARQYSGRAVEPDWQAPFGRCPFGFDAGGENPAAPAARQEEENDS
ncbi:guanitoxin biosynthesis heme-dependent pre-guanitoxin N-hydroxylase GntA [Deinococcus sp. Marseille-Q6407]|uniref:guanitoxin biosynthesis heme-dependent pre-guanitoxin N-hydroxylase GntA n=1 Tax=Deinococcus sp. Marseille-Q6407 TaxID=2969223 RepID=UPI0021C1DC07|nr:guanitoxin biosynthesis heme-dependent pre-guanitoxin N-hydroxylase GntA [Deinococcus sp. Marseille-Q6407]